MGRNVLILMVIVFLVSIISACIQNGNIGVNKTNNDDLDSLIQDDDENTLGDDENPDTINGIYELQKVKFSSKNDDKHPYFIKDIAFKSKKESVLVAVYFRKGKGFDSEESYIITIMNAVDPVRMKIVSSIPQGLTKRKEECSGGWCELYSFNIDPNNPPKEFKLIFEIKRTNDNINYRDYKKMNALKIYYLKDKGYKHISLTNDYIVFTYE